MAHVRKQLRDWLKANLKGSAQAAGRVYVRRVLPLAKNFQTCLLIELRGEQIRDASNNGGQERIITVRVTAAVKGDSEASENTLDALGVFVEQTFANEPTLGGVAMEYEYQAAEFGFQADGEQTLCSASFTFAVMVHTNRTDPETAL